MMKRYLWLLLILIASSSWAAQQVIDPNADYKVRNRITKYNANFTELYGLPSYSISSSDISDWDAKQNRVSGACGAGYAIRTVNADGSVTCEATGVGGVSTWLGLTDTPSSYTANYWVKVNSAGTGLELTTAPAGGGDMLLGTVQTITANKIYSDAAAALFGTDSDWDISSSTSGRLDVASNSASDTTVDIVNSGSGSVNMTLHGTFTADAYASPQTTDGPQFTVFREDSDNGTNYVGWGSQASNNNDLVLLLPVADPANQVLQFAAPAPVTFSDGVTRDASVGSWVTIGSGSSLYVVTPPTYSDEACTAGQYAIDGTALREYLCAASGNWDYIGSTGYVDWNNPTPATYTMTLGVTGDGTISINSTDYISTGSPHTINGLSGTVTMTAAYGSGENTLTWSGTDSGDVTGSYPTYQIDMGSNKNISADFSASGGAYVMDPATDLQSANWTRQGGANNDWQTLSDANDATYMESDNATNYLALLVRLETACTTVSAVTIHGRISSINSHAVKFRIGSAYGADINTTSTITDLSETYATNPDNGNPWTCADLDNAIIGLQTRAVDTYSVAKLWVEVQP